MIYIAKFKIIRDRTEIKLEIFNQGEIKELEEEINKEKEKENINEIGESNDLKKKGTF